MQLLPSSASASSSSSSSRSNPNFSIFSTTQNPNTLFKFILKIPNLAINSFPYSISASPPRCSSRDYYTSTPLLDHTPIPQSSHSSDGPSPSKESSGDAEFSDRVLVVRRPAMEIDSDGGDGLKPTAIDAGLAKFAKKMPIFEPIKRVESGSQEKPLVVNLDLSLYKAKVLARSSRYEEAKLILEKCLFYWPEDGRVYVSLGKVLSRQSKTEEARVVYERGCQATQGENPFVWQCWAVMENKIGNTRRARELFDAATVADKKHIAAWHGWAVLELKQGNIRKGRQLLAKGLKFSGGNEYVYQTLALLEAKANRYERARYLFRQATKCNPRSCASWLAWAQLEMQQENSDAARLLFEKAIQASPKNRFAWHVWGVFEANVGNVEKGRKLLKIGHALNPRDPVLLQSLALLEYKSSDPHLARVLFRKASQLDPRHQPVWTAWGWMEWKEGNISKARGLYERAISIDSTSETAARCLQAWGVLEQRIGNLSAARRLFRSSLNINSQSYITWMTWAQLEEDQGNAIRAEEIRNLYFQQRTEVVNDASWVMGLLDVIDPAIDRVKRLLKLDRNSNKLQPNQDSPGKLDGNEMDQKENDQSDFDLDAFLVQRLSLDPSKLEIQRDHTTTTLPRIFRRKFSRAVY